MRDVVKTTSPSMDIQISSNFERLLFEASARDAAAVRAAMAALRQGGAFTIAPATLEAIHADFSATAVPMPEVDRQMADTLRESGYLADPHTATALRAWAQQAQDRPAHPGVVLATAHPAKFPDAVTAATGVAPQLPAWLGDLMSRKEHLTRLPNDLKMVEDFIRAHRRQV